TYSRCPANSVPPLHVTRLPGHGEGARRRGVLTQPSPDGRATGHVGRARPRLARLGSILLFFLQAEDGIRARNVTGVQTCALPILQQPFVTEYHASLLSSSCTLDIIEIYKTTHDITFFLPFHNSLYIQVPLHNLLHVQP